MTNAIPPVARPAFRVGVLLIASFAVALGAMELACEAMEAMELSPQVVAQLVDLQARQAQLIEAYCDALADVAALATA